MAQGLVQYVIALSFALTFKNPTTGKWKDSSIGFNRVSYSPY